MEFLMYFSRLEFLILLLLLGIFTLVIKIIRKRSKRPLHDDSMLDSDLDDHSEGKLRNRWFNFLKRF